MLKVYSHQRIEELIGSTMELTSFRFVEPISLGYLPFQTQNSMFVEETEGEGSEDEQDDALQVSDDVPEVRELIASRMPRDRNVDESRQTMRTTGHSWAEGEYSGSDDGTETSVDDEDRTAADVFH